MAKRDFIWVPKRNMSCPVSLFSGFVSPSWKRISPLSNCSESISFQLRPLGLNHSFASNSFEKSRFILNGSCFALRNSFLRMFSSEKGNNPVENSSASSNPNPSTSSDIFSKTLKELEGKQKESSTFVSRKQLIKRNKANLWKKKRKIPRQRQPDEAWARLSGLKTSVKKLNLVARLIRKLPYTQAIIQLKLCQKKNAGPLLKLLQSARYNAENNHGLNPDQLFVEECWVGKDPTLKRIAFRGRGHSNVIRKRYSKCHVILKQLPVNDVRLYTKNEYRKRFPEQLNRN